MLLRPSGASCRLGLTSKFYVLDYLPNSLASRFPFYKPPGNQLSVWAESYGGHWGPGVAAYIEQQNDKIETGTLKDTSIINLDTVGIINGGIDFSTTANSYPDMAYNNTYGFQAITEAEFDSATANLTTCKALINSCQELAAEYDPNNYGNNATVNSACSAAYRYCYLHVEVVYLTSGVYPPLFPLKFSKLTEAIARCL